MDLKLPNVSITRYQTKNGGYVNKQMLVDDVGVKDDSEDSIEDKDVIVVQPDIILDEYDDNDSITSSYDDSMSSYDHRKQSQPDDYYDDSLSEDSLKSDEEMFEMDASLAELCTTEHAVVDSDVPEITIEAKNKSLSTTTLTTPQLRALANNPQLLILAANNPQMLANLTSTATSSERPYKCDVCPKAFRYNSDLKKHFRTHTGERPYKCELCQKTFSRSSHLTAHKRVHTGERPYTCDLCDKQFKDKSILARHKRLHNEKKFECNTCDKAFLKNTDLRIHERTHAPPPLPPSSPPPPLPPPPIIKPLELHKCNLCDKEFKLLLHLEVHRKTHLLPPKLDVKPAPPPTHAAIALAAATVATPSPVQLIHCDICKKQFMTEVELKKHKRTHSTDRPYACITCGKAFSCFSQLEIHNRVHTGELPYRCDICNKLFNQRSNLQTHKKRHLGTHMNKCMYCDKSFSTTKMLKNHLLEYHMALYAANHKNQQQPPLLKPTRAIISS